MKNEKKEWEKFAKLIFMGTKCNPFNLWMLPCLILNHKASKKKNQKPSKTSTPFIFSFYELSVVLQYYHRQNVWLNSSEISEYWSKKYIRTQDLGLPCVSVI